MNKLNTFDNLKQKTWVNWCYAQDLLNSYMETYFDQNLDISHQQFLVLLSIENNEGPITETEITEVIERNLNTISSMINRLEKRGFVKRMRNSDNRRTVSLSLTSQGKEMLYRGLVAGWQFIENIMAPYSEKELASFCELLEKFQGCALTKLNKKRILMPNMAGRKMQQMIEHVQNHFEMYPQTGNETKHD